jgi:hypothetical protein
VAGELLPIGTRPKLVASFDPPDALAGIPADAWRVEYGRTGVGPYVRLRVDEAHLPGSLTTT